MSGASIRVVDVGKRYRLGALRGRSRSVREAATEFITSPLSNLKRRRKPAHIWALRDVSFELKPGDALGVIGANGAGKSTLLKILSRITEPTEGSATIAGRVGSLLEVGTGFHPELSGRDNIFLNGAILGMRRAEIRRRFDEIVAFAELEKFIDTPVKRYSSGMHTRLAFAVAAHLDCEILLVDEVLAVGDAGFQRKCLGKMDEVTTQGRTVLLVSHNLSAIGMLTRQCLWLHHGRVVMLGDTKDVVSTYAENPFLATAGSVGEQRGVFDLRGAACRQGTKQLVQDATFLSARLLDTAGRPTDTVLERQPFTLELTVAASQVLKDAEILGQVRSADNYLVFTALSGKRDLGSSPGLFRTSCVFSPNLLRPGWYRLVLFLASGVSVPQDWISSGPTFQVVGSAEDTDNPRYAKDHTGVIRVEYPWSPFEADGAR